MASSDAVKPAITSVWNIISAGLRDRALFVLVIGLGFIGGGLLAGPGRHEVAVRRFLAPYLRERPVVVYAVLAFIFLLWLTLLPTINNLGQVLVVLVLAGLAVVGVEILRRQTAREFPDASTASDDARVTPIKDLPDETWETSSSPDSRFVSASGKSELNPNGGE